MLLLPVNRLSIIVLSDRDMGARHRARAHSIHIIRVEEIAASKCRRPNTLQFHVSYLLYFDAFGEFECLGQ